MLYVPIVTPNPNFNIYVNMALIKVYREGPRLKTCFLSHQLLLKDSRHHRLQSGD